MSVENFLSNIIRPKPALAPVSLGKMSEQRVRDIVRCIGELRDSTDSRQLSGGETADWYNPETRRRGGSVSIESAYRIESDMRDVLDGRLEANNLGWDEEGSRGLTPCDLLEYYRKNIKNRLQIRRF